MPLLSIQLGDDGEKDPITEKYADYLIQWRLSLWNSIRHKELLIWSFIGFFATANGVILGAGRQYISPLTELLAVLILSFLGAQVVLDANVWNARNLFTISRIEKLFIGQKAGMLIPPHYLAPLFRFNTINTIHLMFIAGVPLLFYLRYTWRYFQTPCCSITGIRQLGELIVATLLLLLLWALLPRIAASYRDGYFAFRRGFQQDTDGSVLQPPTLDQELQASLSDPAWLIASIGISVTATAFVIALVANLPRSGLLLGSSWVFVVSVGTNIIRQLRVWIERPNLAAAQQFNRVNRIILIGSGTILFGYGGLNYRILAGLRHLLMPLL